MNDEQYADWASEVRATHPEAEANRILTHGAAQHADRKRGGHQTTVPEQHAATIREALIEWGTNSAQYGRREKCLTALDALVALARKDEGWKRVPAEDLRQAAIRNKNLEAAYLAVKMRAEAAEERASQLEHERDEFRRGWANEAGLTEQVRAEAEQARREADQLRAALEAIDVGYALTASEMRDRARAALAGVQAKLELAECICPVAPCPVHPGVQAKENE